MCVSHGEGKGKAVFGVSEGLWADAEWQQRQTAGYPPVFGSEQGEMAQQASDRARFMGVSVCWNALLLEARFQSTLRLYLWQFDSH